MYFIANQGSLFISDQGESFNIDRSFPQFNTISALLQDGDYVAAMDLVDQGRVVHQFGEGKITVSEGIVRFGKHIVDNSLTKRILQMIGEGKKVAPMANFLTNLMDNPSSSSIKELYSFLDQNSLPITDDGCFIAYKNVNDNYMDKHSRTFDNSVGKVCEMERFEVNDDRNQTCSAGLHFCSIDYLQGFWGTDGHTMLVKINPSDVVSIPTDYNNAKGRTCKYEVVAEVTFKDGEVEDLLDASVWEPVLPEEVVPEPTTNELLTELIKLQS